MRQLIITLMLLAVAPFSNAATIRYHVDCNADPYALQTHWNSIRNEQFTMEGENRIAYSVNGHCLLQFQERDRDISIWGDGTATTSITGFLYTGGAESRVELNNLSFISDGSEGFPGEVIRIENGKLHLKYVDTVQAAVSMWFQSELRAGWSSLGTVLSYTGSRVYSRASTLGQVRVHHGTFSLDEFEISDGFFAVSSRGYLASGNVDNIHLIASNSNFFNVQFADWVLLEKGTTAVFDGGNTGQRFTAYMSNVTLENFSAAPTAPISGVIELSDSILQVGQPYDVYYSCSGLSNVRGDDSVSAQSCRHQ